MQVPEHIQTKGIHTQSLTRITCVEESKPGQINYKSYVPVIASESLINTFDKNDLRKTHYLIWEEIDYNGTPVYRQPTSKYDVQRRYKIEYRYERAAWRVQPQETWSDVPGNCWNNQMTIKNE